MRTSIVLATVLAVVSAISCQKKAPKTISLVGSETVKPLAEAVKAKYLNSTEANCIINISGGGSGNGINALINGETDIAMSSRPIKVEEMELLKTRAGALKECILALDDIIIIVHPQNPIGTITVEQLRKIYTDSLTNWKEINGNNSTIQYVSRKQGSGSLQYFKENVLKGANMGSKAVVLEGMKEIIDYVSTNPNAIGFIGSGHHSKSIKTLEVSKDGGKNYYAPTERNVRSMYYPFVLPLYFYYMDENEKALSEVDKFVNYAQSKSGRYVITDMGFVPHLNKDD